MFTRTKIGLLVCIALIAGCARTRVYFEPTAVQGDVKPKTAEEVSVLSDVPGRPYVVLGLLEAHTYELGSMPLLIDALPEIKTKAAEAGADAIIIRGGNTSRPSHNVMHIQAEAIKFRD